jgi:exonuclease III
MSSSVSTKFNKHSQSLRIPKSLSLQLPYSLNGVHFSSPHRIATNACLAHSPTILSSTSSSVGCTYQVNFLLSLRSQAVKLLRQEKRNLFCIGIKRPSCYITSSLLSSHSHLQPHTFNLSTYRRAYSALCVCVMVIKLYQQALVVISVCAIILAHTYSLLPHDYSTTTSHQVSSHTPSAAPFSTADKYHFQCEIAPSHAHVQNVNIHAMHSTQPTPASRKYGYRNQQKLRKRVNAHSHVSPNAVSNPTKASCLLIMSANVNSLRSKINELRVISTANRPNIIALQETKLSDKITSTTLMLPGYTLFRKDRNENGGGVALFVDDKLKPKEITVGIESGLEMVAVRCKSEKSNFIIASIYKPPIITNSVFIEWLSNFIATLGNEKDCLIFAGDTNICALQTEFRPLEDLCKQMNMRQVITEPTHKARLIDQIFISKNLTLDSTGIGSPVEKYHSLTWARFKLHVSTVASSKKVMWRFKRVNWIHMNVQLMKSSVLSDLKKAPSVHAAVLLLQDKIKLAMEACIPKVIPNRRKINQWVTPDLVNLFKAKQKAYRKWKTHLSSRNLSLYKSAEKKLRKEIFTQKQQFYQDAFRKCQDSASFWKTLNSFTGRKTVSQIPSLISSTGEVVEDDNHMADLLCQQFASVFSNSSNSMVYPAHSFNLTDLACPKAFLKSLIKLPQKKAMGPDEIPAIVLKSCALVIAPCLAEIANMCLTTGEYPNSWKVAVVTPVPKVIGSASPADYRPVSLLPILSKIVESHINRILTSYIDHQLSDWQFGFRKGRSTSDALLVFQHHIFRGFELCERSKRATNVVSVFFDMAKAFDTVPHDRLLTCLEQNYRIPDWLLRLLSSYLSNRTMKVKVNGSFSCTKQVLSGVPQGSILGPTLFIAYIDSLSRLKLSKHSKLILYADDMALIHPIFSDSSRNELQKDIETIGNHVSSLSLSLNARKCEFVQISLSRSPVNQIDLSIQGETLKRVSSYKYLGIVIDEKFTFEPHVKKSISKARQGIGVMNRMLRKWASVDILKQSITSIVFPSLFYGIEVWFPHSSHLQSQLEKVNKFAARLILNDFSSESSYESLLSRLNWNSISRLVTERRLINLKKYIDGTRFMCEGIFESISPVSTRCSQRLLAKNTHNSLTLRVHETHKNSMESKMSVHQSILAWNTLDDTTIKLKLWEFKEAIRSDLIMQKLRENGIVNCP